MVINEFVDCFKHFSIFQVFWCFFICKKMYKNDGNKVDIRQCWAKGLPWKIMKNYLEKKEELWPGKVILLLLILGFFSQVIF